MKKICLMLLTFVFVFIMSCSRVDLRVVANPNEKVLFPINTTVMVSAEAMDGTGSLVGSAFAIDKDRLVTAGHVCSSIVILQMEKKVKKNIKLTLTDDKGNFTVLENTKIIKVSQDYDLCVLEKKKHGVKTVRMMTVDEYESLKLGDPVVVIGAPAGIFATVTEGRITSFTSADAFPSFWRKGLLTISAPCYGGNSGGPVFVRGKLVGVLVMGLSNYDHVSFATDVVMLRKFLDEK